MKLTPDEIEEGAQRLFEANKNPADKGWNEAPGNIKSAYRQIVTGLAGTLDVPHSRTAVAVFHKWLGDGAKTQTRG